ncbi:hypothetical protein KGF57_005082 [Candida theae]|uniref:Uncharacterized protein n=1 Tax=Candida theae TaxID=1198502 RepID=A0AAD5BAV1_9ASCO|nr:uncharacterized protein KGF57_005082 [Candida theae]KAI5948889.1 hypothetical protein KGF57_005082 [Candida theae]
MPGLTLHYPDIVNFTSIPVHEQYNMLFASRKTALYSKMLDMNGKFNIDSAATHNGDTVIYWNGIIDKEVRFLVPVSGFYCVYIVPDSEHWSDFELRVEFKQHYGNLNHAKYVYYTGVKTALAIAITTLGAMLLYSQRRNRQGRSHHLSFVEGVTKSVIYLTLIPFIFAYSIEFMRLALQKCSFATYEKPDHIWPFELAGLLARHLELVWKSHVKLLFSMGLGVAYCYDQRSPNYEKFPVKWWYRTSTIFVLQAMVISVTDFLQVSNSQGSDLPMLGQIENSPKSGIFLPVFGKLSDDIYSALSLFFCYRTIKKLCAMQPKVDVGRVLAFLVSSFILMNSRDYVRSAGMALLKHYTTDFGRHEEPKSLPPRTKFEAQVKLLFEGISIGRDIGIR